ncbi:MAG: hypothetical protein WC262_10945 [Bacteroidales bacterium]|jgi:hypothetical protein
MITVDTCRQCGEPLRITTDRQFGNLTINAVLFCPSGHGIDGTGKTALDRISIPMDSALLNLSYDDAIQRAMLQRLAEFRARRITQKEIEG